MKNILGNITGAYAWYYGCVVVVVVVVADDISANPSIHRATNRVRLFAVWSLHNEFVCISNGEN